jgi:NTP pyrophosphatase (non-canonical NTP hydrolase)
MAMHNKGLTKLMEECGELIQICAKKSAYMNIDRHPDGSSLKHRLEDEIADVVAALTFVVEKFDLDVPYMDERSQDKLALYEQWNSEE